MMTLPMVASDVIDLVRVLSHDRKYFFTDGPEMMAWRRDGRSYRWCRRAGAVRTIGQRSRAEFIA